MLIRRSLFLETAFDGLFGSSDAIYVPLTGGITKRENEVKGIALVFSELRKGAER